MAVLGDVELAVTESVPQLDGPVARARDNLTVVRAEADAEDITSVADEAAGGETSVQVPETERLVPRGREGELTVRRDHNVRDEVVVAVEDLLGVAVVGLVAGELPDNDSLVARGGEQNVRVLLRGRNSGDPTLVAGKASLVSERLRPIALLVHVHEKEVPMQNTHMSFNVRGSRQLNWWYKQSVGRRNSALRGLTLEAPARLELEPFLAPPRAPNYTFFRRGQMIGTCRI